MDKMTGMKHLYTVTHTHQFGTSSYLVKSSKLPAEWEVLKGLEIDFEPDKGETLKIEYSGISDQILELA